MLASRCANKTMTEGWFSSESISAQMTALHVSVVCATAFCVVLRAKPAAIAHLRMYPLLAVFVALIYAWHLANSVCLNRFLHYWMMLDDWRAFDLMYGLIPLLESVALCEALCCTKPANGSWFRGCCTHMRWAALLTHLLWLRMYETGALPWSLPGLLGLLTLSTLCSTGMTAVLEQLEETPSD